jgi:hypothetical protein
MGFAALFSSLALMASDPATLALTQAAGPPPSQGPVSTTNVTPDTQAEADAIANGEDPFPSGAPTDDYGFMGWCYGALAGHLALYDKVLPQVRRIEGEFPDADTPLDKVMDGYKVQHERGEKILLGYGRALDIEEATGKTRGAERSAVVANGREAWKGSDTADQRQLAQAWMSWSLPDRCESTAARLAPSGD